MPWWFCVVSNVLLALLLALAAWFVRRCLRLPRIAHILWVLVLVKLVTPPLVSVPVSESPSDMACTLGLCSCDHHSPTRTFVHDTLPLLLLALWSVGAGTTAWAAWRRWARLGRLLAHASPASSEWQALAAHLAASLSLRCLPEILAVPGRLPPLVIPGRPGPRLLLPLDLVHGLDESQRVALLLHELVHIQRGDHLVRLLELAVGVIYWWLPLVGSIGRQLRACEETCCDAAVVAQLPQAQRAYARLLLDVLDFTNPSPALPIPQATAMSAAHDVEQRLLAILHVIPGKRHSWPVGTVVLGLACAILPCTLHHDFVGRPALSAASTGREPASEMVPWPRDDVRGESPRNLCCPS